MGCEMDCRTDGKGDHKMTKPEPISDDDVECGKCGRLFILEVELSITYTTRGKKAQS